MARYSLRQAFAWDVYWLAQEDVVTVIKLDLCKEHACWSVRDYPVTQWGCENQ